MVGHPPTNKHNFSTIHVTLQPRKLIHNARRQWAALTRFNLLDPILSTPGLPGTRATSNEDEMTRDW
jgi:hypothetical protein